jgi:hypothetical protein
MDLVHLQLLKLEVGQDAKLSLGEKSSYLPFIFEKDGGSILPTYWQDGFNSKKDAAKLY